MGHKGGTTAAGLLRLPTLVIAHRHPGPCTPSHQRDFPTASVAQRPAPEPTGGSGLGSVEGEPTPGAYCTMGAVEWGAIVPDTACRWITATAQRPMQPPPACHCLLPTVPPLAPHHALIREVWRALLNQCEDWMTAPGARCPAEPVLEGLTAPIPKDRLHSLSTKIDQLTDELLDLALEPLRVLYPQAHIPPAGMSNRLARLGMQHRVEAAHAGGLVDQWLTLRISSPVQGHWYLHQLLLLPQAALEPGRMSARASRGSHIKCQTQYANTQPNCFIKVTKTLESTLSEAYNDSCVNGSRNASTQKFSKNETCRPQLQHAETSRTVFTIATGDAGLHITVPGTLRAK